MHLVIALFLTGCAGSAPPAKDTPPDLDTGWSGSDASDVVLAGAAGPEGALLWSDAAGSWIVEVSADGAWEELRTGPSPWGLPPQAEGAWFRLRGSDGSASAPFQPPYATTVLDLDTSIVGSDGTVSGLLEVVQGGAPAQAGDIAGAAVQLRRVGGPYPEQWLDSGCLEEDVSAETCWGEEPVPLHVWRLPELGAAAPVPVAWQLQVVLVAEQQGSLVVLDRAEGGYVATGRRLVFGDLHAHSNLSHDGCETLDETCSSRGGSAGSSFFSDTPALDFAAITDHAEHATLVEADGSAADVWAAQQALVADADADTAGPLPLIGYEWTAALGHRTVLFEEAAPCEARRLPGQVAVDQLRVADAPDSDRFLASPASPRRTPGALWAGLAAGADWCKSQGRVLTIPHHPAAVEAGVVDWADKENAPNLRHERLVEIVSEHGVAECDDLSAPHCRFGVPAAAAAYAPHGSVQAALQQGRRLGFVGGTDSHDGRPGSIEDGPSCTAAQCRSFPGGLTGVYLGGTLDRQGLFDGLEARNTLATTGPRVPIAAALVSRAGDVFLPGDDVSVAGDEPEPLELVLSMPDDAADEITVELVRADGSVDLSWEAAQVSARIMAGAGDVRYLRVRMMLDGAEERIWLSPFFFGL